MSRRRDEGMAQGRVASGSPCLQCMRLKGLDRGSSVRFWYWENPSQSWLNKGASDFIFPPRLHSPIA